MQSIQKYQEKSLQVIEGDIVEVYGYGITQQEYVLFRDSLNNWRDRLIAKMLRATGIRIGELLKLEARHYKLDGPDFYIQVRRSKKRQKESEYEPLFLQPGLGVEMRDYIKGNNIQAGQRVFKITYRRVHQVFQAAGLKAIGRPVHAHQMRHLYLQTLVDNGIPILTASKMLGHTSTRTTEEWYYQVTTEKRRWIGERMPV